MLDKKTLSKIKKLALKIDWDDAFSGKSKGNRHLFRVVKIAKFLANKTGADKLIVEAGALLHDVPLPSGDDYNYKKNKKIVIKLLKQFDLTKSEQEKIAECVASHEGTVSPKSLEAKIVHDADVLEKSGILGIIRHTWKLTNLGRIKYNNINDKVVQEILHHINQRSKKLQIPQSREINRYLNNIPLSKTQLKKIIQISSKLAKKGVITEKIASILSKQLTPYQKRMLNSQLTLSYLRKF